MQVKYEIIKMAYIKNPTVSIITLNVNRLNAGLGKTACNMQGIPYIENRIF